jgi:hypothetical protein
MKVRADVAELLRAGLTNRAIEQQLHIDHRTVSKARRALRIPNCRPRRKATPSLEELFWQRTARTSDDHLEWTGYRSDSGMPGLRHGGRFHSAYRVAFSIRHGRAPEGKVTSECSHDGCVDPGHVADRRTRKRDNDAFDAIFGGLP